MATPELETKLIAFLPKMRVRAMALTRNKPAADDLVQDVAVKALQASEQFIPGTNFSAWIYRIMINHFISGVRGQRVLNNLDQASEPIVPANQQHREELRAVGVAYQRLLSGQREALRMVVFEGRPYEEVAESLGCAIGTLKSRVHRARLHLRAHMDGEQVAA